MTKQMIPLFAEDITGFSRALARQLDETDEPLTHLRLMNMLARAAGFRNFQHLRAAHTAGERLAVADVQDAIDHRAVEKASFQFDALGRLKQWPSKRKLQELCLWALWARIPAGVVMHERDVNAVLLEEHLFGDTAILRRSLFGMKLVTRNRDGSDYQRCELEPPAEARALIKLVSAMREGRKNA